MGDDGVGEDGFNSSCGMILDDCYGFNIYKLIVSRNGVIKLDGIGFRGFGEPSLIETLLSPETKPDISNLNPSSISIHSVPVRSL